MVDLLSMLQLEHLQGEQLQLATAIGIEAYRQLLRTYAGLSVYVPTMDTVVIPVRDTCIRKEFTGYNYRELAQKYGLTEAWIRNIVADEAKEFRRRPPPGQMSIFDTE